MDKVAIIIPVYNAEEFLKYSVESVLNQTYSNLEIILVNDGSKDSSGLLCDEYAEKDSRVKVIHVDNGGQGRARNIGIQNSNADWIVFLDSDDYYDENAIQYLVNTRDKYHSDLVITPLNVVYKYEITSKQSVKEEILNYSLEELVESLYYGNTVEATPCGKLYKKSVLLNNLFPEGMIYEDLFIAYKHIVEANNIVATNVSVYNYYQRKGSTTKGIMYSDRLEDFYKAMEQNKSYIEKDYPLNIKIRKALKVRELMGGFQIIDAMINSNLNHELLQKRKQYREELLEILKNKNISKNRKIKYVAFCIHPGVYKYIKKMKER